MNSKQTRRYTLIILIVVLILIFFIPVKIPFTIKGIAKIYPEKEWRMLKDKSGSIYSSVQNYETALINNFTNYEFERGDIAKIKIASSVKPNKTINKGDTVITITSMLLKEEINELKGKIEVEEAILLSYKTGERPEDINIIKSQLLLAKQNLKQEERNFKRINKLHNDSAISNELFEAADNTYKMAGINVNILEMKLAAAKKGKKPEDISMIKANIKNLKEQISLLERRQKIYSVVSPLTGIVSNNSDETVILAVASTDKLILEMAVKPAFREYINSNSVIQLQIAGLDTIIENHNIKIDNSVKIINNRQVLIIKSKLENKDNKIAPGMILNCKIKCEAVSMAEHFKRSIKVLF